MEHDTFRRLACVITGHKGPEALNRLVKLVVIGAMRDKGFVDKRNENLKGVFARSVVCAGTFNLLVRFAFLKKGWYEFNFASGVSVGDSQSTGKFASGTGRSSKWVGGNAEQNWDRLNVSGVVLVGLADDFEFFFIERKEFLEMEKDRIRLPFDVANPTDAGINAYNWIQDWKQLELQPGFASILGEGD